MRLMYAGRVILLVVLAWIAATALTILTFAVLASLHFPH